VTLDARNLAQRRNGARDRREVIPSFRISAPLRLCVTCFALALPLGSTAAEIDVIKIAVLVDGMVGRGAGYDASELHARGVKGLAAVLDHLLPDTAPPAAPLPPGPPEEEIRRLIARLDADEFKVRETATEELIAQARGRKPLIEEALASDSTEIRFRAARILASWESYPATRLSAYLSGFWVYVEGIADPERLLLLAQRTVKAFEKGMPEGDRLHLLRLCIAGVAHGRDDASCDVLRPLLRHPDVRVATLVTETTGAYKTEPRFVPWLLVDALASDQKPVVEAALRFVVGCQDDRRRARLEQSLHAVFRKSDEALKFQACLPLVRDYHDSEAWLYVLQQVKSSDANRVRTALNWIGDTKNCGETPDGRFLQGIERLLAVGGDQRRAAVQALGTFAGESVVRRLIGYLADSDSSVSRQAEAGLLSQPDRELVKRLLNEAETAEANGSVRSRVQGLLVKIQQP
jgi:hypothetical protein